MFHFFVLAGYPDPCWAPGTALGLVYWRLASQVWEGKKIAKPLKSTKKAKKSCLAAVNGEQQKPEMPQSRSRCYAHAPATTALPLETRVRQCDDWLRELDLHGGHMS